MFDAIVLAGGAGRRLGGIDKPALQVGPRPLLAAVVSAVAAAGEVVVVGPHRDIDLDRPVRWCREDPPGGGPVAAVAAALPLVAAPVVLVLAADLPAIAPAVGLLVGALHEAGADVALLVDAAGRRNHLAAAWHRRALVAAVASVGAPDGAAMRSVVGAARVAGVADTGGWGTDCDTWDDVAHARRRQP